MDSIRFDFLNWSVEINKNKSLKITENAYDQHYHLKSGRHISYKNSFSESYCQRCLLKIHYRRKKAHFSEKFWLVLLANIFPNEFLTDTLQQSRMFIYLHDRLWNFKWNSWIFSFSDGVEAMSDISAVHLSTPEIHLSRRFSANFVFHSKFLYDEMENIDWINQHTSTHWLNKYNKMDLYGYFN